MTAALQQAIKLLPLSRLELVEKVQQEMLDNPFLEEVSAVEEADVELAENEPAGTPLDGGHQDAEVDWQVYLHEDGNYENYPAYNGRDDYSLESTLRDETSLADYLLWQLSLSEESDPARQHRRFSDRQH